jgi:peptide/nickel transport system permease protein
MAVYIVRRLIQTVFMLFVLSILFFLLVRYQPTSGCAAQLGCQELLKLDEPITTQYITYVTNMLHANPGVSTSGTPVATLIAQRLPATIILIGTGLVLQQLIALPLGILGAVRQYSRYDQILTFISYLLLSMPAGVLGTLCIFFLAQLLGWFPQGGSDDLSLDPVGSSGWFAAMGHDPGFVLGDLLRHLVLPACVLAASGIAIDSRFMRSAMLQVLHQDYIRTATAKGVPRHLVIFKHAFRNALLPIITNLGLYLPALIGGAILVDGVFSYGGLAYLFGGNNDFPTMQSVLLLCAVTALLGNLLADVGYAALDPRIRYDGGVD